jgi:acyl carrier protein
MTVLTKVREILKEVFGVDPRLVSMETEATDMSGWDSVGHLSLCGALEETFKIQFDANDLAEMNSIQSIITIIKAKKDMHAEV